MGKFFVAATLVAALTASGGCAHHSGGDDDGGMTYSSVRVVPDPVTLVVPLGGTAAQDYQVLGTDSTGEHDITSHCTLDTDAMFGAFTNATLAAFPHGGTTQVTATCGASIGSATLNINLTGTQVTGTAPGNSDQIFGSA